MASERSARSPGRTHLLQAPPVLGSWPLGPSPGPCAGRSAGHPAGPRPPAAAPPHGQARPPGPAPGPRPRSAAAPVPRSLPAQPPASAPGCGQNPRASSRHHAPPPGSPTGLAHVLGTRPLALAASSGNPGARGGVKPRVTRQSVPCPNHQCLTECSPLGRRGETIR